MNKARLSKERRRRRGHGRDPWDRRNSLETLALDARKGDRGLDPRKPKGGDRVADECEPPGNLEFFQ